MVFQNYALFPHMSVRQNIGFGLAMQGRPKAEIARKVDEALAIVRLGDQGDKLPGNSPAASSSASPSRAPSSSSRRWC